MGISFYAAPGPFTELTSEQSERIRRLSLDPPGLCLMAQGLLVSPPDAVGAGLSEQRLAERNTRPASRPAGRVLELDGATPLGRAATSRAPSRGDVSTLRGHGDRLPAAADIPARARCGFATYFVPPKKVDHWIVEYWSSEEQRWIRTDPEYLDRATPGSARTDDLRPDEFLTAGEAWQLIRSG